jgi:hypothetical protein
MKITGIETIALSDPGKASAPVVRVHTDEGLTGNGQAESPSTPASPRGTGGSPAGSSSTTS